LLQKAVDVDRTYGVPSPVLIQVLKQLAPGQLHAELHNLREPGMLDFYVVLDAAFASKIEVNRAPGNLDVTRA
jgi:hypothetical protein